MKPEILAPAGNWEMLSTAINAGADAIYFGIKGLNMRAKARNFSLNNMSDIVKKCHLNNTKAYLAINTIIFDEELDYTEEIIQKAKKANIDAIICWDLAVISIAKKYNLTIHLSTQASAANSGAISEYEKLGIKRVILARECSLEQIKKLKTNVELEVFIHGAMCVAVSGRCFMSQYLYGKSANRGECIQPCRRSYDIQDPETGKQLQLNNHYIMSPKDLCTIDIIDKLIEAEIKAFKIEGRNRSPEYVKTTVEVYKRAIDSYYNKNLDNELKHKLKEKLKKVYNRGFSSGFYLGTPIDEWCDSYGSKSTKVKEYVGKVINYYKKAGISEIKIETGKICIKDIILIQGPTTGCIEAEVNSIQLDDEGVQKAEKGTSVGIPTELARKNDKVYVFKTRNQNA